MDKASQNSKAMLNAIVIAICVMASSCGTPNSVHSRSKAPAKLQDDLLEDRDGNKYPVKVLLDSNLWMTANLNLNIQNSYCYENASENCGKYGRLYVWTAANQGCSSLGESWRLPTDGEWLQLVKLYGGTAEDSKLEAYKALLYSGTSGFNAVLGGNREPAGTYARKEFHGFYWTATENDSSSAWYYNFGKGSQALFQQEGGEKKRAFSVHCVKSIRW
jgi:uncharacterized protein (TIGR02145 family)